ncbi:Oligopeptide transport ATP-binding protein OppF [Roseobacter fucihabitans]|uniref:Oligopeptide transport ATP-binding protein OppF n=1 Tax=Roseobacter fucihabitans TaxID=1537242 RepID=A0ABZ2BZL5_9RHOB|nr:ABC transporter ATP-binding protein [Roseobacter litoralis]MBC6968208.1 Oligopeptide transport ATP-binding protein OppF [Roseobacter litoralis]
MSEQSAPKPLIRIEDLSVHFKLKRDNWFAEPDVVHAVDGVSFDIQSGQTLGLVGESGCGKTTTGRALLGLVKSTTGHVLFDDTDLSTVSGEEMFPLRQRMQIIFQDPYSALNPRQTAGDIVMDPLVVHNVGTPSARKERVEELFALVGLRKNQLSLYPHQFSGGQRQRICIARALALNPQFIVCDEPVSALDVAIQAQILNLLCKLQDELNLTYLFISHDLAVVQHMCDEIAVMYLGVIVERADRKSLFENPRHPYTRALLSAVLTSVSGEKIERIRLEGDIPNPINKPSGCRFRTRCPFAQQVCSEVEPVLEEKSPNHWEACHFHTSLDVTA